MRGGHFLDSGVSSGYWGYSRDCACSPQLAGLGLWGLCGEPQFPYPNAEGLLGLQSSSGLSGVSWPWAFREGKGLGGRGVEEVNFTSCFPPPVVR